MKGYRTILFAVAVFLLGVLQSTGFNDLLVNIGLDGNGMVTTITGIVIAILRYITTSPVGEKF